jgi:hypothetical protein
MTRDKKSCKTCYFCEKYEVPNAAKNLISNFEYKDLLPDTIIFYKCHIQGPPQKVNIKTDWCYKWVIKDEQTN